MTTEEKLIHFREFTMQDARLKSNKILDEHSASLNYLFEQHKAQKLKEAKLHIKMEIEQLEHDKNKELSRRQIHYRRKISNEQRILKDKLFEEVKQLLDVYMTTPEYDQLLINQIIKAKQYARDEIITIYIDPKDSQKLNNLVEATKTTITISEYPFYGGTRAVIPGRNILIDNSFKTKLEEEKEKFSFNGGISNE